MKLLTILGARPQFIKAGSISREISKSKEIKEVIVHTGQHYDSNMSDIFFEELRIPKPDYNLGIGGKTHGAMTGQMIEKIEEIAFIEKPDCILVYGDTNSTLAGALVASKLHIKLAHVEAGLRSNNLKMPEEVNRIITDRISNILFCPSLNAVENLRNEGFENFNCKIFNTGDVMLDGLLFYKQFAKKPNINLQPNYVLCTIHRAENTDDIINLKKIFKALNKIASKTQIILPIHPRTRKILNENHIDISKVTVIEPVGYLEMVWLLENCVLVITDSGGLQKEAYFFKKYCVTLRNETEWKELIDSKVNILVGSNTSNILQTYHFFQDKIFDINNSRIYGDGNASQRIIKELLNFWRDGKF